MACDASRKPFRSTIALTCDTIFQKSASARLVDGSVYMGYYVGVTWKDEDAVGGGVGLDNADALVPLRRPYETGG